MTTHTVAVPATRTPDTVDSTCAGDCNGDSTVTLDELIQAVNVALGLATNGLCPLLDRNHDGIVAIDEVVLAVDSAIEGCAPASE